MKTPLSLLAATLVLSAAYTHTFGFPFSAEASVTAANNQTKVKRQTTVSTQMIKIAPFTDILQAVGTATAISSVDIKSEIEGVVTETNLNANRQVEKGEILVRLDNSEQLINLDIARAELEQTWTMYQRYVKLDTAISEAVREEARTNHELAKAEHKLAEHELALRNIVAPISGDLGLSDIEIGDLLSVGSDIVTIDDSSAVNVEFELPERAIAVLNTTPELRITTPSLKGRVFNGVIDTYDSRIDSVTRSVSVRAKVDNPERLLWSGMTFSVQVMHESEPAALIPAAAITWNQDGSSIWVSDNDVAKQLPVTILHRSGEQVWVEGAVDLASMVVTEGSHKLRPGARISSVTVEENGPSVDSVSMVAEVTK